MESTFVRIFDKGKNKEILINLSAITEIQVEYVEKGKGRQERMGFAVGLEEGRKNPESIRVYHVCVGNVTYTVPATPASPVTQIFDDIYKNAIKGDD